mgnify:CR=1 FL=1
MKIAHFHVHLNRCFGRNIEETNCGSLLPAMISKNTYRLLVGFRLDDRSHKSLSSVNSIKQYALFSPQPLDIDGKMFFCVLLCSVIHGDPNKHPEGITHQQQQQFDFWLKPYYGNIWCIARMNFLS